MEGAGCEPTSENDSEVLKITSGPFLCVSVAASISFFLLSKKYLNLKSNK